MDLFAPNPVLWASIILVVLAVWLMVVAARRLGRRRSDVHRFVTLLRASDPAARILALERAQALPPPARARLARVLSRELSSTSGGNQGMTVWFVRQILALLADERQQVRTDAARVLGAVMGRGVAQLLGEGDTRVALAPAVAGAVELAGGRPLTQSETLRGETRVLALAEMLEAGLRPLALGLKQLSGVEDEAMEPLSSALRDRSPRVRRSLVEVLAAMGGNRSVEMLGRLLQDPSPDLRAEAARALGNLRAEGAADEITAMLSDPVGEVRAAAARALAEMEQGRAARAVLAALSQESQRDDASEAARAAMIEATVRLADSARPALAEALEALPRPIARRLAVALDGAGVVERWLREDSWEGQEGTLASLLGRLANLGVSTPLLEALDATVERVRIQAVAALGNSRDGSVLEAVSGLLSDPNAAVRAAAVRSLAAHGEPMALDPLAKAAADPSGMVKLAAATGLHDVLARRDQWRTEALPPEFDLNRARKDAQRALLAFAADALAEVRRAAASGLRWFASAEAADSLASLALDDEDDQVRAAAASALSACEFPPKRRLLASALEDADDTRRARALSLLASIGGPDVPRQLVEALDDPAEVVRTTALDALAQVELADFGDTLAAHLKSRDGRVRARVAQELGRARATKTVGPLVQALADPDEDVRVAVLAALAHMGRSARRHEGALSARRSDPSPRVREAAAAALSELRSSWSQAAEATELFRQGPLSDSAAAALVEMAAAGDADPLLRTIGDEQADRAIAQALAGLGGDRLPDVLTVLRGLADQDQTRAAEALAGALRAGASRHAFLRQLKALDADVRLMAVEIIGRIGEDEVVEPLTDVLTRDPVADVRSRAAALLADAVGEQARAALKRAQRDDPNSVVRRVAGRALDRGQGRAEEPPIFQAGTERRDESGEQGSAEVA
jgi:HEAT repeat protein